MKTIRQLAFLSVGALLFMTSTMSAQSSQKPAQGDDIPQGMMAYSLPATTIHLSVEALCESYTPGPYYKYAKKYLGADVSSESKETYRLISIKATPYLEADRTTIYFADLSSLGSSGTRDFFRFSSQGLLLLSDQNKGTEAYWRFPTLTGGQDANAGGLTQNLISTEAILYKNVKNEQGGYDRVAVQQSQVVEKSLEKKAQEAANMIFSLRKKRLEIITGDTDATFSGEAMKAAIDEITRLEESYVNLFIGTIETTVQKKDFDVIPRAGAERQLYVAFRFSENNGLLMESDLSGRPIVMELIPDKVKSVGEAVEEFTSGKSKKTKSTREATNIFYRIPDICLVKIVDGQDLLLQTRIPVHQLGDVLPYPIY